MAGPQVAESVKRLAEYMQKLSKEPSIEIASAASEEVDACARLHADEVDFLTVPLYYFLHLIRKQLQESEPLSTPAKMACSGWAKGLLLFCGSQRTTTNPMVTASESAILERLTSLRAQTTAEHLIAADGPPEAQMLIASNPFAFLLAACLDRGTKAELI